MPLDGSEIRPAGNARGKTFLDVATAVSDSIAIEIQETQVP
jgi:hypothetical protein